MYSFLSQAIRQDRLCLWHDYRRFNQTFLDLSGQGNDAATTSNVWWGGGGVQFADANGYIRVADAAELRLGTFTLVVLADFGRIERAAANPGFLMTHEEPGLPTIEWQWGIDDTPQLFFTDTFAASTVTLACNYLGKRTLAITVTDGGTPVGYTDGLLEGNYSGAIDLTVGAGFSTYLGNQLAADRSMYNPMQAALIFNDILTATEISVVTGELMALPGGEH